MASILGKLRDSVREAFGRTQRSVLGSLYSEPWMYGVAATYTDINQANAVSEAFNVSAAIYSITMKDADKFGSIPRFVYNADKKEEKAAKREKAAESDLTKLLNRPNPMESQDAFYTKARAYYKVTGEAFILLNRGNMDKYKEANGRWDEDAIQKLPVLEMYCLSTAHTQPVADPGNVWGVIAYELDLAGNKVRIPASNIIHWRSTNLNFDASTKPHLRGMSPLTPGYKAFQQHNAMTDTAVRQAQNDGARAVIFNETLNAMTPAQQSELRSVIDKKINNNDVAGAVATLQGKWGMLDLGRSMKDLEILNGKELSWKELCFLLKVPYEFFDSETTFANKEQAQTGWLTNDIMPACKQLDGEFNRVLPKAFGKNELIASDFSELPEMIKAMAETAKTMLEIWALSPDDVREFLGHDALGGDFAEPWVPTGRTPLSKANMDDGGEEILQSIQNDRSRNMGQGNGAVSQAARGAALPNAKRNGAAR